MGGKKTMKVTDMNSLTYHVELPNKVFDIEEAAITVYYETAETEDGGRVFKEHTVDGFDCEDKLALSLVTVLYGEQAGFADALNEYLQENAE